MYYHTPIYGIAYVDNQGQQIMQSLQALKFMRCRQGEDNINAKLTNAQGLEIFERSNEGETSEALAQEFGVSKDYVNDLKNIRARVAITLDHINGRSKTKPAPAITASRSKNKKLSASLAKFIRADHQKMQLTTQQLATKYCVSVRTIQRILKGQMYK